MDRRQLWVLGIAAVAIIALHLVCRVRIMVAGGKFLLGVGLIIAITMMIWPARRDP